VDRKPVVLKRIRGKDAYFTVSWSRLRKSEKYEIVRSVPSEAGIYELYYMDFKQKLCLFHVGKSWYGGLRNEIRLRTDAELENDSARKALLEKYDCWYTGRFSAAARTWRTSCFSSRRPTCRAARPCTIRAATRGYS
jgi:predicted metal-binding transcription factor (methanogenesis marker protein 9)